MTDLIAERLKEIKKREAKATKGPWLFESHHDPQIEMLVSEELRNDENRNDPVLMHGYTAPDSQIEANWEFLQKCRADVPWLVEQLEKALAQPVQDEAGIRERARKFLYASYPNCLGYPSCDGQLPGEAHIDNCPAKKKPPKPLEVLAGFALSELSTAEQAEREEEREIQELVDWLEEESLELMKQAMSRRDGNEALRGASVDELKSALGLAEKMSGKTMPGGMATRKAAKEYADMQDRIASKLEVEARKISGWADMLRKAAAIRSRGQENK